MRIAVAGATGIAGRKVVAELERRGIETVAISRATGVDVLTGEGLDEALAGVDAVIDVLGTTEQSAKESTAFFATTTANLLAAEARAGVRHHVALSIVGVDEHPMPYYAGKRAQEAAVVAGPVPWTILRATQFHEFAEQIAERFRFGPASAVPTMRTQPIDTGELAVRLADIAVGAPAGRVPDIAGPREEFLPDLARKAYERRGIKRKIMAVTLPGAGGRAMKAGANLPTEDGPRGRITFAEWLEADAG